MKNFKKYTTILLSLLMAAGIQSCTEEIDMSDRYTFTEETLATYLEKHEYYSEYYRILNEVPVSSRSQSTVLQLISARGHYTVFAPTNDAIQEYLQATLLKLGLIDSATIEQASWDCFPPAELDSIQKVIAYNSIIDSGDGDAYYFSAFPASGEEFPESNMNDRRLLVNQDKYYNTYVNGNVQADTTVTGGALIDESNRDITALNGILHQVHNVVAPSNETMTEVLENFVRLGENMTGMANLVLSCGLDTLLSKVQNEEYEQLYLTGAVEDIVSDGSTGTGAIPERLKYGFTIFAETDDFWQEALGVDPKELSRGEMAERVQEWVVAQNLYPDAVNDKNYKNPKNVLNQFVTYHILPARIPVNMLVVHSNELDYDFAAGENASLGIPVWEFHTTVGERRLLKIYQSKASNGICLNRFPNLNNERDGDYQENSCDPDKEGFLINTAEFENVLNGYIYPITRIGAAGPAALAYTPETRQNFQKYRIRFDVTTLFPEFLNNDLKMTLSPAGGQRNWAFPIDNDFKYLENLSIMEGTKFHYLPACDRKQLTTQGWKNFQFDEFNVTGQYEMIFRMPPVPVKGTYELRYAIQSQGELRGMCQVYFGTDPENLVPQDIPLDMNLHGATTGNPMGWLVDQEDEEINAETDKKMRNYRFMKGPNSYYAGNKGANIARNDQYTNRRIIVRQEMDPDEVYYLKFKSVLEDPSWEFYLDYLEFCAKEVYDNPLIPEDIW